MKGKISFYFNAPNTAKVRSRIEKPSENFTPNLRQAINDAIIEVVNEQTVALRAKLAVKFQAMGETVKDEATANAIGNVLNNFWDVFVSAEPFREDAEEKAEKAENAEPAAPADDCDGPAKPDEFED